MICSSLHWITALFLRLLWLLSVRNNLLPLSFSVTHCSPLSCPFLLCRASVVCQVFVTILDDRPTLQLISRSFLALFLRLLGLLSVGNDLLPLSLCVSHCSLLSCPF